MLMNSVDYWKPCDSGASDIIRMKALAWKDAR